MPVAKLTAACSGSVGCAVGSGRAAAGVVTSRAGAITHAGHAEVVGVLLVVGSAVCVVAKAEGHAISGNKLGPAGGGSWLAAEKLPSACHKPAHHAAAAGMACFLCVEWQVV